MSKNIIFLLFIYEIRTSNMSTYDLVRARARARRGTIIKHKAVSLRTDTVWTNKTNQSAICAKFSFLMISGLLRPSIALVLHCSTVLVYCILSFCRMQMRWGEGAIVYTTCIEYQPASQLNFIQWGVERIIWAHRPYYPTTQRSTVQVLSSQVRESERLRVREGEGELAGCRIDSLPEYTALHCTLYTAHK